MKTSNLFVRIEPNLKYQTETILSELGLSMSGAITLFFKQIVINRGLPFEVKVPMDKTMNFELMTEEELNNEICAGFTEIKEGKGVPAKDAFEEFNKKHGI